MSNVLEKNNTNMKHAITSHSKKRFTRAPVTRAVDEKKKKKKKDCMCVYIYSDEILALRLAGKSNINVLARDTEN